MKTKIKIILLTLILIEMNIFATAQNAIRKYKELEKPEKQWTRRHPIAALRTYKLSQLAANEAIERLNDKDFDGDGNGGMVDAFRHTLWMALTTQKIGRRKALTLGKAHEDSNKIFYEKNKLEDGSLPDSISCEMDLLNNECGAKIGQKYPKASFQELTNIVKQAVISGQCFKIKKNAAGDYLDYNGNIIDPNEYLGRWHTPKILVKSNFKQ